MSKINKPPNPYSDLTKS